MLAIPTSPVPNQVFNVILGGQACRIAIAQKNTGMFLNLYVNDALVIGGVLCEVANPLVRSVYLGFTGDLAFYDTQPAADPLVPANPDQVFYTGLGSRYFLAYLP